MIAMGIAACVLTLWLVWRMSDREAREWCDRMMQREWDRGREWSRPVSTTARTAAVRDACELSAQDECARAGVGE